MIVCAFPMNFEGSISSTNKMIFISSEEGIESQTVSTNCTLEVSDVKTFKPTTVINRTHGQTFQLGAYFILWYGLTVVYNITNKRVLNSLPLPATVAVAQLFLGIPLFLPVWITKRPHLSRKALIGASKVALMHALGNLCTVYSLGAGAVSFTHVVKSAEPIFAAVLSAVFLRSISPTSVYCSLLPIVLGVSVASVTELSFSWFGFTTAMMSNLFYQARIVLAKLELGDVDSHEPFENNLSPAQLFRIVTVLAAFELLPLSLFLEGDKFASIWNAAHSNKPTWDYMLINLLVSGFSYYMYNEVAFWILGKISPMTHAVGNTVKRVVIILAAVIIMKSPITFQGAVGSGVAIAGTFLYSLMQQRHSTSTRKKGSQVSF